MDIRKLQRAIVDGLEDVKGQDIVVFNTEHLSPLFERVIIASGTSNRQTKALASGVRVAVKEAGFDVMATEGGDNGEWIIVDCGAAVVHVMQPNIRDYYRLEEIWGGKPVKIKLGSDKPKGLVKASEPDDEDEAPAPRKAAGKTAAKKAAPARKAVAAKPQPAAPEAAAKRAASKAGTAKKGAPAKKAAAKPVAAAKKAPARKKAAAPEAKVQTIVVKAPIRKSAAAKSAGGKGGRAAPAAPAARKTAAAKPARKAAAKTTAKRG